MDGLFVCKVKADRDVCRISFRGKIIEQKYHLNLRFFSVDWLSEMGVISSAIFLNSEIRNCIITA
jgi:hypothetical protein